MCYSLQYINFYHVLEDSLDIRKENPEFSAAFSFILLCCCCCCCCAEVYVTSEILHAPNITHILDTQHGGCMLFCLGYIPALHGNGWKKK